MATFSDTMVKDALFTVLKFLNPLTSALTLFREAAGIVEIALPDSEEVKAVIDMANTIDQLTGIPTPTILQQSRSVITAIQTHVNERIAAIEADLRTEAFRGGASGIGSIAAALAVAGIIGFVFIL